VFRFFQFHWLCLKQAWRGCWTRANELAGALGGLILFVVLYSLSPWMRDRELIDAPSTYWGAAGFAAGSAIASTILAFGVIFLLRLVLAPMQMYWSKNEKIGTLEQKLQEDRARIEELETKLRAVEIEQNTIGVREAGGISLSECHPNRVQASRLKPQVKSALVETEEFKAVINFYLKEQNPNFPGSSDAINTMEERYAARIALMQRDEYHWGLLQTEGSLIDWALLALWVGNLRRYKSPPKEFRFRPAVGAVQFIRELAVQMTISSLELNSGPPPAV
jgi:hypothetical protein